MTKDHSRGGSVRWNGKTYTISEWVSLWLAVMEPAPDLTLPPFDQAKCEKVRIIESTPMGTANPWYEMWEKAKHEL